MTLPPVVAGRHVRGGRPARRPRTKLLPLVGATGLALLAAACVGIATPEPSPSAARSPSTPPSFAVQVDPASGLRVVAVAGLPPQALAMIRRIRAGGPFPDPADGAVFANAALVLPERAAGYYQAYEVPVPGTDAGMDLIVAGARGEMYWTTDGARTFARVVP